MKMKSEVFVEFIHDFSTNDQEDNARHVSNFYIGPFLGEFLPFPGMKMGMSGKWEENQIGNQKSALNS